MILAIDVGGTAIKSAVWENSNLLNKATTATPKTKELFEKKIQDILSKAQADFGEIDGVAMSVPGAVNTKKGIIGGVSAVPYIHHYPFASELSKILQVPVTIENDANCAALAEIWQGAAQDVANSVILVIGSGIGGAISIEKELVKGKHLFGGEFGYMQINDEETFSTAASPVHNARKYSEANKLVNQITGKELFELADQGDELASHYVNHLKDSLARGIFNLLVAIDPDKVLIGGAISEKAGFIEDIESRVQDYLVKNRAKDIKTKIVPCHFYNDANLVGAVVNYQKINK